MKFIIKQQEPKEFSDWKSNDKMYQRNKPNWNRLPSNIKEIIRKKLVYEQGGICCYCERQLVGNDFHIEHLKPKDKNKYPELQLEYDNLICSCQFELEKEEPRHCGNSKGSWYDETHIISPLNPDCEKQFKYTHDGHIEPNGTTNIMASTTIQKLRLDLDRLNKMREKAIEPFLDEALTLEEMQLFAEKYLEKENGKFNPFYTTIKYLFGND